MKKLILFAVVLFCLKVNAQIATPAQQRVYQNCTPSVTLKITQGAIDILNSYKRLFENTNSLCKGSNGTLTSFGIMSLKYYGNPQNGEVSFSSFYTGIDIFRTIWGSVAGNFTYYGACAPDPILWPNTVSSQNHIWELKFVPIANYAKAPATKAYKDFTGVSIADIKSIDCFKIEESNGYAAATEPSSYSNTLSSKGIVAYLTLKNGSKSLCYIVNNLRRYKKYNLEGISDSTIQMHFKK